MRPAQLPLTPPHRPPGRRRGGFTMIEILIVIGIIILLVSIGVVAFSALDQSAKVTKTMLGNLQAMLAEFQAMTDLRDQPQSIWRAGNAQPTANNAASLWREPALISTGAEDGKVAGGSPARYEWSAVANTQLVYRFLSRVPNNKKVMTALPSKQVMGMADADKGNKLLGSTIRAIDPPLVLDAWNNPIIFVGSDGLLGVNLEARPGRDLRITSTGILDAAAPLPANRRPFFASAGPDGDFRTGDDNLYSFDQ